MEGDAESIKDPIIVHMTTSAGRFYECIFCKRGFSTAQALGGHMNIHRKDRAKMRHNPSPSSQVGEDESEYYSEHRSVYPPVSESLKNYGVFLPSASGSIKRDTRRGTRELSLFGEDLKLGFRVDEGEREVLRSREIGERGEVDLELRLGYEP